MSSDLETELPSGFISKANDQYIINQALRITKNIHHKCFLHVE
jgi:hypothetical protein